MANGEVKYIYLAWHRVVAVWYYLLQTNINLFFSLTITNVFMNQYSALCVSGSNISAVDDSAISVF